MFKNLIFIVLLLLCASVAPAVAQNDASAEKQAAIKELTDLLNGDNRAEDLMRMMSAQMETAHKATLEELIASETALTAAQKDEIRETLLKDSSARMKAFQEKLIVKLQFNELMEETISVVYDKNYTLAEIKDLLAFYRTPTGQKTLRILPQIASESMQLTTERLLAKLPAVLEEIKEEDRRETQSRIKAGKSKPKTE